LGFPELFMFAGFLRTETIDSGLSSGVSWDD